MELPPFLSDSSKKIICVSSLSNSANLNLQDDSINNKVRKSPNKKWISLNSNFGTVKRSRQSYKLHQQTSPKIKVVKSISTNLQHHELMHSQQPQMQIQHIFTQPNTINSSTLCTSGRINCIENNNDNLKNKYIVINAPTQNLMNSSQPVGIYTGVIGTTTVEVKSNNVPLTTILDYCVLPQQQAQQQNATPTSIGVSIVSERLNNIKLIFF